MATADPTQDIPDHTNWSLVILSSLAGAGVVLAFKLALKFAGPRPKRA